MAIIRVVAVDPRPVPGKQDVLVYQVPEKSREMELLIELFESQKIEWVTLSPVKKPVG